MTDIVFMGSPDFAVPSLKILAENNNVTGVVTQPDRPAGRGRTLTACPVKAAAVSLGLPVIQPVKLLHNSEALQQIKDWRPEVIVVAAYGKLLRAELLDLPPRGCVNVHASLLPRWRGASPIQASILHGDQQSGVTLMLMDPGLDTGPMLSQRATAIQADDTAESLESRLAVLGAQLLQETLPAYLTGSLIPQAQPEDGDTYAPLMRKEDGLLDFSKPALQLERQVRAYNPWPGCFTYVDGAMFKVHRAEVADMVSLEPRQMAVVDGYPAVGAADGALLLREVQPSGKKSMDGKVFLMGYHTWDHQVG